MTKKEKFIPEITINEESLPFKIGDTITFGGKYKIQKIIEVYLQLKGYNDIIKNSERFKINCIMGENGSGKTICSNILQHKSYIFDKVFILDDFSSISKNIINSVNSNIILDNNLNTFYSNLYYFITKSNINKKFICNYLSIENFDICYNINFNLSGLARSPEYRVNKIYDFDYVNLDIDLLLSKCNNDKNIIISILYLYSKFIINYYHYDIYDEYNKIKDKISKKIKKLEKKYSINELFLKDYIDYLNAKLNLNTSNRFSRLSLPSEYLGRDVDHTSTSQDIADHFSEIFYKDGDDYDEIFNLDIKVIFADNYFFQEKELNILKNFLYEYGEIHVIFKMKGIISFEDLSAGEKTMLIRFINIYSEILYNYYTGKKDFIIYIDEPDLHLHLNWQKKYIKTLIDIFSLLDNDINLHFILATHSPFIISDLPKESIILLDKSDINKYKGDFTEIKKYEKESFGANFVDIINDGFFFDNKVLMGSFAEEIIGKIAEEERNYILGNNNNFEEIKGLKEEIGDKFLKNNLLYFKGKNENNN